MSQPTLLLIVDENDSDRLYLEQALYGAANRIISVPSPAEAHSRLAGLGHVSALIAGIPGQGGEALFDFRDQLCALAPFRSVFCSRNDMSPWYPRVREGDKLFYKPVELPVLRAWLLEAIGPPAPEPQLTATTPPSTAASVPAAAQATAGGSPNIADYEEDLPVGTQLGDYRLERLIQRDVDFALYEAEQTSINRKVAIKTLYRKHRRDPVWVQAFVSEASARAKVSHPNVSLVYECVQEEGVNFYTLEMVNAPSLADLAAQKTVLSDNTLWGILEAACGALEYFQHHQMYHRLVTAQTILLQNGDQPRIANPVKKLGAFLQPDEEFQQMQHLGAALRPFIRKGSTDPNLYSLIDRLGQERIDGIKSIAGLRRNLSADTSSKASVATAGRSGGKLNAKTAEIVEKERNKKAIVTGIIIGGILVLSGVVAASIFLKKPPEIREFNSFSHIRAGSFPYLDGPRIDIPDFYMGQKEVTIAQYNEFLEFAAANPTKVEALKHPDQPATKTNFIPDRWNEMKSAAFKGKRFEGAIMNPNFPITGVDWWDAYAYARWKNARLPTEKEWEKAARGGTGRIYPWGNELDASRFNSGIDQTDTKDQKAGSVDGFQFWCAVDDKTEDMSPYGIQGMAGNVSEWTADWGPHPDHPDKLVPIKRGGSWKTKPDERFEATVQRASASAEERNFYTGFRIVSDILPGSDPNYTPPPPVRIASLTGATGAVAAPKPGSSPASPATPAQPQPAPSSPPQWDPADGVDPFTTIFATPASK